MLILVQYAWESETAFLRSFQVIPSAAGPSTTLSKARVVIPTQDSEIKNHSVFILPGQCLRYTGPQNLYIGRMDYLGGLKL